MDDLDSLVDVRVDKLEGGWNGWVDEIVGWMNGRVNEWMVGWIL